MIASAFKTTILVSVLSSAPPEDFTGQCVGVSDGDTISVMSHGKAVRVRLDGVDCPESGTAFAARAK